MVNEQLFTLKVFILLLNITYFLSVKGNENVCYVNKGESNCGNQNIRYLLYDVNPVEGFNLRRDVYMRLAIAFRNEKNFRLVLPPWPFMVHWKRKSSIRPIVQIPWSHFFDVKSLQRFAPVIEMSDFFHQINGNVTIDTVYSLQHFSDMFESGKFVDKMMIEKCIEKPYVTLFYFDNITASNIVCLSFHGPAVQLTTLLKPLSSSIVYINRAEVVLHSTFGDQIYWKARRSMRFSTHLRQIADTFRKNILNSTNEYDNIHLPILWEDEKPGQTPLGGPYLSVHFRRKGFWTGREDRRPSINNVINQIAYVLQQYHLTKVYIASDNIGNELKALINGFDKSVSIFYMTDEFVLDNNLSDGQIAIVEQIICSHGKYFLGTAESTFTFRIQEEREILGFPTETTFNNLCADDDINKCAKPSIWNIQY